MDREAAQVAGALKARRSGDGWIGRCPCPGHGNGQGDRKASLTIAEGTDGRLLLKCFAGCEFEGIVNELKRRGIIDTSGSRLDRLRQALAYVDRTPTEPEPNQVALEFWDDGVRLLGTPATNYLERRGIIAKPTSLRYHASSRSMVAAVQRPDGEVIAVQRTFLTPAGAKAAVALPRLNTGAFGGGAVRLAAADDIMGLAEGVETALSAMAMADLPVWASLSCQRLHRVILPAYVREVHIFCDNDEPGHTGARHAADVHRQAGRHVVLRFPPVGVKDFNDLLMDHADCDCGVSA
jgi:putative DNA primase/helicase